MKNIKNKLLVVIAIIGTSSTVVQADGFFKSVGNVATLGELNRSERREEEKKSKKKYKKETEKKKQENKSSSKKSSKKYRKED